MATNELEVPEDATVTSAELNHMMLILEDHNRIVWSQGKHFYWQGRAFNSKHKGGPFKSFLAALCHAIAPWYGENG